MLVRRFLMLLTYTMRAMFVNALFCPGTKEIFSPLAVTSVPSTNARENFLTADTLHQRDPPLRERSRNCAEDIFCGAFPAGSSFPATNRANDFGFPQLLCLLVSLFSSELIFVGNEMGSGGLEPPTCGL